MKRGRKIDIETANLICIYFFIQFEPQKVLELFEKLENSSSFKQDHSFHGAEVADLQSVEIETGRHPFATSIQAIPSAESFALLV